MPAITVSNLHKRYGPRVAVEDVSFTVEEGEIFGILGPNGAGKTTTVETVGGLRAPDRGTVRVLGLDPRRDRDELRRVVGIQLQESRLPDRLTVAEALHLYTSFYRHPADADTLLERLGLAEQRRTAYAALSGGQQQRLSVALALAGDPRVAILDELTTGLDPQGRRDTWGVIEDIRDRGVTVVLVSHFMEEAERLCDRVAVVDRGRVVALDTPSALASGVAAPQRLRFRPSRPFDPALLTSLPEVTEVAPLGDTLLVTGTGEVVQTVLGALARNQITAADLRVEQSGLDEAYLNLVGRTA